MNTNCAVSSANHLRALPDVSHPLRTLSATEHLKAELQKGEVCHQSINVVVFLEQLTYPKLLRINLQFVILPSQRGK